MYKLFFGIMWVAKSKLRIVAAVALFGAIIFYGYKSFNAGAEKPQYQTAQAEKGILTTSVTVSGTVSQASGAAITTSATGIVSQVYVTEGDLVTAGQKIAEINLDSASAQKQATAWASYLSAKNSLTSTQNSLNSLNSAMWKTQQVLMNGAVARDLATDDPTFIQQNSDWLKAEADYKNQQNIIVAAQASLNSSWLSYAQISPVITAPMSGKISGLNLAPGIAITGEGMLGTITAEGDLPQVTVNLTEIDVVKVKPKQKVILKLDALPDQSFTGVVSVVNTNGSISSGVTTYPATITFDTATNSVYPNMAVNTAIITSVKNNVILVPSGAVQTNNGTSIVRVINNGQTTPVQVEVGNSNDTQTEIVSGLPEGETIIIGQANISSPNSQQGSTSPFSGTNRGFGGGAGGFNVQMRR